MKLIVSYLQTGIMIATGPASIGVSEHPQSVESFVALTSQCGDQVHEPEFLSDDEEIIVTRRFS
ncbi:hypothetical protein BKG85_04725 [Mycobacteroides chelonae]|nr:hypothetical protein BKG85_04725 [Mycobacteroides chelonae]